MLQQAMKQHGRRHGHAHFPNSKSSISIQADVFAFASASSNLSAILPAAAGVVRLAAAFAAHNRRDLLDDFAGLNFRREFR